MRKSQVTYLETNLDAHEVGGAFRKAVTPKRYCGVSHQLTKRAKVTKVVLASRVGYISKEREDVSMEIILKGKCPLCGKDWSVAVTEQEYDDWRFGELIQNALPSHTPEQRECLISGFCADCQKMIFEPDDEDFGEEG